MKVMRPSSLHHGGPQRDSSNLSLVTLIDEWSCIEAKSYPVKDANVLRRIRFEIKKFIYANVLHKTRENFLLFQTFYSYRYDYGVAYVGNQHAFERCAGGGDWYGVLRRHYKKGGGVEEAAEGEAEEDAEEPSGEASGEASHVTSLFCNGRTANDGLANRSSYAHSSDLSMTGDAFHLGGTHGRDKLSPQLYTCMISCCLVLLERRCYLEFICLYLYVKAYFSLDSLPVGKGAILKLTSHESFLNVLLLLSDLTSPRSSNGGGSHFKRGRQPTGDPSFHLTQGEKKDMYSLKKFEEDLLIRNVSKFSYNVLFLLNVKINFHQLNYNLDADVYDPLCRFVTSFGDAFTSRFVARLNELDGLTLKCGRHIWGGSYSEGADGVGSVIPIGRGHSGGSPTWGAAGLASGNYPTLLPPNGGDISTHQSGGIFTHFTNRKETSGGTSPLHSLCVPQLSAKEASYYNISLFDGGDVSGGEVVSDIYQEEEPCNSEREAITMCTYVIGNNAKKTTNEEEKYLLTDLKERSWRGIRSSSNGRTTAAELPYLWHKSIINSIYVTLHKNIICSLNSRIEEYRFFSLKRFFHFISKNESWGGEKGELLTTCKHEIVACLLGHESPSFFSRHTIGGRARRGKPKWKDAPQVKRNHLNRFRRGNIYISKNYLCVNRGVAFWLDKKKEETFRLRFEPFRNLFSSPFYQRYFHLFLFFARVGTLVRYVQAFVRVFTGVLDGGSGDSGGDSGSGGSSRGGRHEEDTIPVGDVFSTFVNAVAKYLHVYAEQIRRAILHGNANTPLDIYGNVKRHTECIELLAFLCSSYTHEKEEVFRKRYFVFYNPPPDGTISSSLKQVAEYNALLNAVYGLSHSPRGGGTDVHGDGKVHGEGEGEDRLLHGNRVKRSLRGDRADLFVFPRGSELLSYVYRYYYLFLSSRRKHLAKMCRFLFLRVVKPLLHFLYAYVFLGVNRDVHYEYIISKRAARTFFFALHKGVRYYERGCLRADSLLSLPVFLKYAIGVVHRAGELSRILRSLSEEDFQLAIPKVSSGKSRVAKKKKKKKKITQMDKEVCESGNQVGSEKEADLPHLLCSSSTATIEHFFHLQTNPSYKKRRRPSERFENVFIELWNDEERANLVFSRTRRNIRKRLQRYVRSFRSALSRSAAPTRSGSTNRDDITLRRGDVHVEGASRGGALHTCRLTKSVKLRVIAKRGGKSGSKQRGSRQRGSRQSGSRQRGSIQLSSMQLSGIQLSGIQLSGIQLSGIQLSGIQLSSRHRYRRDATAKGRADDSSDRISDESSFPPSDDTTASSHGGGGAWREVPSKWHHVRCAVGNGRSGGGGGEIGISCSQSGPFGQCSQSGPFTPLSLAANTLLDEGAPPEERRALATFRIDYEDDGGKPSSSVPLGRRPNCRHAPAGDAADFTQLVHHRENERGSYPGGGDHPCDLLQNHGMESGLAPPKGASQKMEIKSISYFLYRNVYVPIEEHYDNVNRILVGSFLLSHNLLAFVCLLKSTMFLETEEKHRVFSSLLRSKKGGRGASSLSSHPLEDSPYERHASINAYTSEIAQLRTRQSKLLHHRVDSHCHTDSNIATQFAHIQVHIEVPHSLGIFFDEQVVSCYVSVYKLTALLYFTRQSLNGIFEKFRRLSKPLVYRYSEGSVGGEEEERRKKKKGGTTTHFRASDFKYMHVINSIARGNASSEGEKPSGEEPPPRNCHLSRNTCNARLTGERFFSIGLDEQFIRHPSICKFVSHAKILSDVLKDLNQIRTEMDFLLGNIHDYIIHTNILRSYFFFFNNVLKIGRFSALIEFHRSLAEHLHHFAFLSPQFLSLNRVITNLVNLVHVFRRIMDCFSWVDADVDAQEPVNFSQSFQEHTKQLERTIILLTSAHVQEFIGAFYASRNELVVHVRAFRGGPLGSIYDRFFFNGFYARVLGEDAV
ncbi:hypothetical protein PVBG_04368 [Plasmodium vivax Brazil I]|uniref:Uncharacterized protein n=1 Tax=Plasmodium vivax (strain Brazil I) TaxID=1033975 RepID=A0A0J9SUE4_PLAV1|nr:hypothetical protein PVBG_04368 [Plasmodium vivax Brazil I]